MSGGGASFHRVPQLPVGPPIFFTFALLPPSPRGYGVTSRSVPHRPANGIWDKRAPSFTVRLYQFIKYADSLRGSG